MAFAVLIGRYLVRPGPRRWEHAGRDRGHVVTVARCFRGCCWQGNVVLQVQDGMNTLARSSVAMRMISSKVPSTSTFVPFGIVIVAFIVASRIERDALALELVRRLPRLDRPEPVE